MVTWLWQLPHRRFDIDELEHAHAAWSVAQGLVPYRDFFEHHTPALYLLSSPLFAALAPANSIAAATRTLLACRIVMWMLAIVALALTYRLARFGSAEGPQAAALAVLLLATSFQFLNTTMEFRPDVPALVCLLSSFACLAEGELRRPNRRTWRPIAGGIAFSAALLFTQTALFVAPGLAVALLYAKSRRTVVAFAVGLAIPLAIVAAWFMTRGSFGSFVDATTLRNAAINTDRRSPLPGLLGSVLRNAPLYAAGVAGAIAAARGTLPGARADLLTALASLAVGVAVIGRVYDQYYLLMLPLLAIFGGAIIARWSSRAVARSRWVPAASMTVSLLLLAIVVPARFESNDQQLADIGLAMQQVPPGETIFSGIPGAGTFRPHAWYYFFLVGPFASAHDYEILRSAIDTGRIRPRLVIFDAAVRAMPAGVLDALRARYRRLRGDFYLRTD
jgi:hypothetical protein